LGLSDRVTGCIGFSLPSSVWWFARVNRSLRAAGSPELESLASPGLVGVDPWKIGSNLPDFSPSPLGLSLSLSLDLPISPSVSRSLGLSKFSPSQSLYLSRCPVCSGKNMNERRRKNKSRKKREGRYDIRRKKSEFVSCIRES